MSKFFVFALLWWLLGNPFLALLVLLVVLYVLDRRYIGLFPSVTKPLKRSSRLAKLKRELLLSPHDTSAKHEAAKLLMEKRRWKEALELLGQVAAVKEDSADVLWESGLCRLKLGDLDGGERNIREALEMNPRVAYGEPYLRLAEAIKEHDQTKALGYLEQFGEMNSSSCEGMYRYGDIQATLGRKQEAKRAFSDTIQLYRALPRYMKRKERRYALLALLRGGLGV